MSERWLAPDTYRVHRDRIPAPDDGLGMRMVTSQDSGHQVVAYVREDPEDDYRARLIAAAPEMVELLVICEDSLRIARVHPVAKKVRELLCRVDPTGWER